MLRIVGRFAHKKIQSKPPRLEISGKNARYYAKEVCPPPPPPKKKGSSSGGFYTLGALALVGGATIGYAKYDPDFRQTLTEHVPYTDKVIRFVFQEDGGFFISVSNVYDDIKKSLSNLFVRDEPKKPKKSIITQDDTTAYKAPPPVIPALEDTKKPEKGYTEIRIEKKNNSEVEIGGDVKVPASSVSVPETHPSNLAEIEKKISDATADAINAYNKAINDLRHYNHEIPNILERTIDRIDKELLDSIKTKTKTKNETIKIAERKTEEALKNISKLKVLMAKSQGSQATGEMVNIEIEKTQNDLNNAQHRYEMEKKVGNITEKYWEKVLKARQFFCEQLESLFPSVDIYNKKMSINEADLDLFVMHAFSLISYYQNELAKHEILAKQKLDDALESAKKGGFEVLNDLKVCEALEEQKRQLTLCFKNQCLKLRKEAEQDLREQLKRQSQTFADHLDEAVATRAAEIERTLMRKFDEELDKERTKYKVQTAAMVGRVKGLEHAFKARDDADRAAKQSQVLWAACQALLRALKAGCPGIPWKEQLRPLSPEIIMVQKAAAKGDELVNAVINGIPEEAKERGVFPEDALRERFLKVEEVARRMALISEKGAALPMHILSYVQSLFLIKSPSPIPSAELNDEEVDFSRLSTNEILQRARYWLDRGDFAQTLKYMNLLEGAPKSIARQWIHEARILLETQQAANTLMAHAASSGLLHL